MKTYFSITPSEYLSEGGSAVDIIAAEFEAWRDELASLQEKLNAVLRDLPFDRFKIHFHSFEPEIEMAWTDDDPAEILGLKAAIWERLGEKKFYDLPVPARNIYYRHRLTGLELRVQLRADRPGATYGIYTNADGQRYIGKITPVEEVEADNDDVSG